MVNGQQGSAVAPIRLARDERRELLLDAAAALVASGSLEEVSMDSVAERAGVSRLVVYKHFCNRGELLGAVYRREASHVHDELASEVAAQKSLEDMFRALVHGALRAAAERGHVFAALRAAGAWSAEVRHEQRERDTMTSRVFARRAVRELGIDRRAAAAGTAMMLSLIDPVVAQWRLKPTPEHAAFLEETYMTIVSSSLAALAQDTITP